VTLLLSVWLRLTFCALDSGDETSFGQRGETFRHHSRSDSRQLGNQRCGDDFVVLRSNLDLKMVASARPMAYFGLMPTHRCQYPELILRDVSQIRGV
jgi:hypothetical protein